MHQGVHAHIPTGYTRECPSIAPLRSVPSLSHKNLVLKHFDYSSFFYTRNAEWLESDFQEVLFILRKLIQSYLKTSSTITTILASPVWALVVEVQDALGSKQNCSKPFRSQRSGIAYLSDSSHNGCFIIQHCHTGQVTFTWHLNNCDCICSARTLDTQRHYAQKQGAPKLFHNVDQISAEKLPPPPNLQSCNNPELPQLLTREGKHKGSIFSCLWRTKHCSI